MQEEEWRDIRDYEGLYMISSYGRVKSLGRWVNYKNKGKKWQKEKILKPLVKKGGYLHVGLHKNGKIKNYLVHRLVAEAFIQNPNNYPQVNHKDENPSNNFVNNLEFCTAKYNVNYGTRLERVAEKMKGKKLSEESKNKISEANSKPVLQIDQLTDTIIAEFPSINEVQRQLGINQSNISKCCLGKINTSYGFKWQYK